MVDATFTPKLKSLTLFGRSHPVEVSQPFIGTYPQLQVLRIESFKLTPALAEVLVRGCPNLQLLKVSMNGMDASSLMIVLRALPALRELILCDVPPSKVREVVSLLPRSVSFGGYNVVTDQSIDGSIDMMESYPNFEYLSIAKFIFSRFDNRLLLSSFGPLSAEQLSRILSTYRSLESLSWTAWLYPVVLVGTPEMASLLVDKCRGTLKSLTLHAQYSVLTILLRGCGALLQHLDMDCKLISTSPFALIAATCPHLVSLSLRGYEHCWDEDGFSAILANCTELRELLLEIRDRNVDRRPALQAILSHRLQLRLKQLTLLGVDTNWDLLWLREQTRYRQLVPLPTLILHACDICCKPQ